MVEGEFRGVFAGDFVDFLRPYIGLFGLWVFWAIILLVSTIIVLDKGMHEIALQFGEFLKSKKQSADELKKEQENINFTQSTFEEKNENNYIQDEYEDNYDGLVEDDEAPWDIETPSYLRQEENEEKMIQKLD